MSKISAYSELAEAPASTDEFVIVDKSDTSMAASGTTKKVQAQYLTISDASTTVKGKVELATDAETITGTDTIRTVTPSNITAKIDTDGTFAGNSDTRIPSQKAVKTYTDTKTTLAAVRGDEQVTYYGMSRQAIMNGNFDVWQRGTSVALADLTLAIQADRWQTYIDKNGGTLPTLTISRQLLTSGDIPNAFYFHRLTTNGAGTSLGVSSNHNFYQRIENGVRNICGLNKKVTVSFWAKSDITNKRICPILAQVYGTGGSPSAQENIKGTPITLTSSWVKYTTTFTTNTLVGKTFGTNGDDYLQLNIPVMWGTTHGNTYIQTSVSAETYIGPGNIDIAQVQLCSGDVALPFQPKSFEEELRACQRYYEVGDTKCNGYNVTGGVSNCFVNYKVQKRIVAVPTLVAGSHANCSATSTIDTSTINSFSCYVFITSTNTFNFTDTFSVNAEL